MKTKTFGPREPNWAGKVEFIERPSSFGEGTNFIVMLAGALFGTIYFRPLDATWCYRIGMGDDELVHAEDSDLELLKKEIIAEIRRRKS